MASVNRIKKAIADLRAISDRHEDIDIVCDAAEEWIAVVDRVNQSAYEAKQKEWHRIKGTSPDN